MVKEWPILFSGDMVRALLAGRKTQTRRVVKPQPTEEEQYPELFRWNGPLVRKDGPFGILAGCPYGQPGDRLWVRENLYYDKCGEEWCYVAGNDPVMADPYTAPILLTEGRKFVPSIHMPREASRILLEIVSVRVERLQDISEADAVAEGYTPTSMNELAPGYDFSVLGIKNEPRIWYEFLWDFINGGKIDGSWAANPWVWVVEFKVIGKGGRDA